jgi:formate hydrogenlyase subunit 6/NADH:ubiquinone oxidoreductase subunit I
MISLEALKYLFKKAFTYKYPYEPMEVPEGFRGKPEFDEEKCIACGACASICPAEAIIVEKDEERKKIRLTLSYSDCAFCAECQEHCPEGAISLTDQFELAVFDRKDAVVKVEKDAVTCEQCGKVMISVDQMKKIKDIVSELNIPSSDLESLNYCPECRRSRAAARVMEVYR